MRDDKIVWLNFCWSKIFNLTKMDAWSFMFSMVDLEKFFRYLKFDKNL